MAHHIMDMAFALTHEIAFIPLQEVKRTGHEAFLLHCVYCSATACSCISWNRPAQVTWQRRKISKEEIERKREDSSFVLS